VAGREDDERVLRRHVGPLHRYALQAADLADLAPEEGALAVTAADSALDQVKLAVEERVVGVGYPKSLAGVGGNCT
jgi:hypothetical protein